MAGGVDDGNVVLGSLELPQSNIDGDATLALGLQLVHDPSILEGALQVFIIKVQYPNLKRQFSEFLQGYTEYMTSKEISSAVLIIEKEKNVLESRDMDLSRLLGLLLELLDGSLVNTSTLERTVEKLQVIQRSHVYKSCSNDQEA